MEEEAPPELVPGVEQEADSAEQGAGGHSDRVTPWAEAGRQNRASVGGTRALRGRRRLEADRDVAEPGVHAGCLGLCL